MTRLAAMGVESQLHVVDNVTLHSTPYYN